MKGMSLVAGMVLMMAAVTGCSTTNQTAQAQGEKEFTPPTSIYNVLDSTAMIYSDPGAASPTNDSPFRWLAFLLHPIGQAFDYAVNRPLYGLASTFPSAMGYTQEDALVDAQRR